MLRDLRIYIIMIAVGAVLIFAVSLMPPLTSGGTSALPGVTQAELEATLSEEMAHCEGLGADIDCQCYAGIAGYVRAAETAQVPFTRSVDQTELARRQAAYSC